MVYAGLSNEVNFMEVDIAANINSIKQRIAAAAAKSQRAPDSIKLLAVTKTVPPVCLGNAIDAGITMFGENYVQEAKEKIAVIGPRAQWHMIGHLQTNKAKYAVNLFNYIHSVDRMDLARELDKKAHLTGHKMNILIEVNVSGEKTKNGIPAAAAISLIKDIARLENISVRGLMTMAPYSANPEDSRPYFTGLRNLRDDIIHTGITGIIMEELSMGMTDDFEIAIEEGATIVRIGRAIFGERKSQV
jgi:pyridoxal phosphate enzyme (YggS family)